jgi:hypothetical protein
LTFGWALQRLDGGQRQERQVAELDALAALELALGAGPQPGDLGQVHLDHRRQLRRHLERLDHPRGDDLAEARHLLAGAALVRDRSRRQAAASRPARSAPGAAAAGLSRERPSGGCRCLGLLGRVEHVLLADPAADAGARQGAEVHGVLRRPACGPAA